MAHGMVITPPCGFFFFDRSFDSSIRLYFAGLDAFFDGRHLWRIPSAHQWDSFCCGRLVGGMSVPAAPWLDLRRSGRPHFRRRPHFSFAAPVARSWSRDARLYDLGGAWPNKGWSRPLLPDHGELAASEQAQLEAARARRGWRPIRRALTSRFNTSTHRRRSFRFPPRGAASGFRRCIRAASTARSSSFQLSLRSAGSGAQQLPPQLEGAAPAQVPPRGAAGSSLHHAALLSARSSLRRAAHDACGPTPPASISKLQYISSSWPQS